jgi:hypothetical protein
MFSEGHLLLKLFEPDLCHYHLKGFELLIFLIWQFVFFIQKSRMLNYVVIFSIYYQAKFECIHHQKFKVKHSQCL